VQIVNLLRFFGGVNGHVNGHERCSSQLEDRAVQ